MKHGDFTIDDVTHYLNQELPGFEPSLIRDQGGFSTVLRVRSSLTFGAYAEISDEYLMVSIHEQSYHLRRTLDEFVRKTRQDMIQKLGLQKEIDLEVQRKLNAERTRIENEAYKKAMNDALDRTAAAQEKAREELAGNLWNVFMGRDVPPQEVTDDAPRD